MKGVVEKGKSAEARWWVSPFLSFFHIFINFYVFYSIRPMGPTRYKGPKLGPKRLRKFLGLVEAFEAQISTSTTLHLL